MIKITYEEKIVTNTNSNETLNEPHLSNIIDVNNGGSTSYHNANFVASLPIEVNMKKGDIKIHRKH